MCQFLQTTFYSPVLKWTHNFWIVVPSDPANNALFYHMTALLLTYLEWNHHLDWLIETSMRIWQVMLHNHDVHCCRNRSCTAWPTKTRRCIRGAETPNPQEGGWNWHCFPWGIWSALPSFPSSPTLSKGYTVRRDIIVFSVGKFMPHRVQLLPSPFIIVQCSAILPHTCLHWQEVQIGRSVTLKLTCQWTRENMFSGRKSVRLRERAMRIL